MSRVNKLILLSSTQYPGYGGAATNTYALIKYLKSKGFNIIGIFFENANVNVDPDNIGNIFRFEWAAFENNNTIKIESYRNMLKHLYKNDPDIMLCKNYRAPYFCKMLYPNIKNIYLLSGISHFSSFFPNLSAQEFLESNINIPDYEPEIESMNSTDLVVANSLISLKLFYKIYPKYFHKIYPFPVDTTKEIGQLVIDKNINISDKKYDFIIAASILTRTDKNNIYLVDILKDQRLEKYSKIIIGTQNQNFINIPNSKLLGMVPHKELMGYMKQSKILLYPSLNDANPNTVREAIYNKCITLISNNIGYYEKFPQYSVCYSYDKNEWINKSLYLIENYNEIIKTYNIDFGTDENILSFIEKFV